jgi:hypothetical protein
MIHKLVVRLSGVEPIVPSDFVLQRVGDGLVPLRVRARVVGGMTVVRLTFAGPSLTGRSLPDGNYVLKYQGVTVAQFHRLFGDCNGNGRIDKSDWLRFQRSLKTHSGQSKYDPILDANADGLINMYEYHLIYPKYRKGVVMANPVS